MGCILGCAPRAREHGRSSAGLTISIGVQISSRSHHGTARPRNRFKSINFYCEHQDEAGAEDWRPGSVGSREKIPVPRLTMNLVCVCHYVRGSAIAYLHTLTHSTPALSRAYLGAPGGAFRIAKKVAIGVRE